MKTRRTRVPGLSALSLCCAPLAAIAQGSSQGDASLSLNPLTVTATLAPRTANETLSSVTVIDEATLRRQDPASLTEVMRGQPGVDVSTNGSYGKTSNVYIRGTGNDATLLLIDGIRLRSATTGGAAWQYLDPRMFERAEIVRGPVSSLYGADAMGGVVQLFTPEGDTDGPQPRFSVGTGSFDTQRYSAGLSGSQGGTRYSFAASRFDTDGQPVRRGGEDAGYDNTTGFVRVSHTFAGGAEIGALGLRARGTTEYDNSGSNAMTDYVQQVAGLYGEVPINEAWRSRLTLSEARDESINYAYDSNLDTKTSTARWINTMGFNEHELIIGAEYVNDSVEGSDTGSGPYEAEDRNNTASFVQGLLDFNPFAVQASLRYDDNEAFGKEVTGSLGLGFDVDEYHTLRASYGTAFKAPTFNDLYWPGFGNPELEAETSETLELGVRGQYVHWFWDTALYQTDIDNLIAGQNLRNNIPTSRVRGIELSGGMDINDWVLAAALTYTDPEDRETGNRLPRRASQSLRLDVDRELGDWLLGGSWIAQNHRYDDAANDDRLPGFGMLNLRAGWEFAPLWTARLTVDNVFDREYETAANYINAGRATFISVNFGQ